MRNSQPVTAAIDPVSGPGNQSTTGVEIPIVSRIRESIRLKRVCIEFDDILDEDLLRLKESIERDSLRLDQELDAVQDEIDIHVVDEAKKYKIRGVLRTVIQSVGGPDDLLHMQQVEKQLQWLHDRIQTLSTLVDVQLA
jgi:hypothetical protein